MLFQCQQWLKLLHSRWVTVSAYQEWDESTVRQQRQRRTVIIITRRPRDRPVIRGSLYEEDIMRGHPRPDYPVLIGYSQRHIEKCKVQKYLVGLFGWRERTPKVRAHSYIRKQSNKTQDATPVYSICALWHRGTSRTDLKHETGKAPGSPQVGVPQLQKIAKHPCHFCAVSGTVCDRQYHQP